MSQAKNRILVWLEAEGRGLSPKSIALAALANDLARQGHLSVFGALLVPTKGGPTLAAFGGLNLDTVYLLKSHGPATSGERAAALLKAARLSSPDILLVAADERGRELAPMVAANLGAGLTANCTSLRLENGLLVQTRPAFGGDLIAEIITPVARPQMATVRLGPLGQNLDQKSLPKNAPYPVFVTEPAPKVMGDLRVIKRTPIIADDDLERASVVIAVGLGLGGPEGVAKASWLAEKLGAALGATRAAVDRGWLPHRRQIGLSVRNISPNLLITLGVSGSVQFMAGAAGAKDIIAVNPDPRAPILALAKVGLVIPVENLWPELEERLGP